MAYKEGEWGRETLPGSDEAVMARTMGEGCCPCAFPVLLIYLGAGPALHMKTALVYFRSSLVFSVRRAAFSPR